jgi:hypothetical protein
VAFRNGGPGPVNVEDRREWGGGRLWWGAPARRRLSRRRRGELGDWSHALSDQVVEYGRTEVGDETVGAAVATGLVTDAADADAAGAACRYSAA